MPGPADEPAPLAKAQYARLDAEPNITVRETRIVDNAAHAARDFTIGETIFREHPLILLPKERKETPLYAALDTIAKDVGLAESYLYPIIYFKNASPDTQGRILEFFSPELDRDSAEFKAYHTACAAVVGIAEFTHLSVEDLIRYLLILRTNQHAAGQGLKCTALYELGSKVTHSCDPNTLCLMDGIVIEYRALKPIKKHEMLTFSYIAGFDLWKATNVRRKMIKDARFFECCCNRCVGPDLCRRMRCPTCGDPHTLYFMPGQASFVPTVGEPTDTPWTCFNANCGKKWRDEDMPLAEEEKLRMAVLQSYFSDSAGVRDRVEAKQMLAYCDAKLGPYHWLSALMCYTQLALHHSALQHKHAEPEPGELVLQWCDRLMHWFSIAFPNNMPEATNARFVAQTAQMYGNNVMAARYFAVALPDIRCHWTQRHPEVQEMEKVVVLFGDSDMALRAMISPERQQAILEKEKERCHLEQQLLEEQALRAHESFGQPVPAPAVAEPRKPDEPPRSVPPEKAISSIADLVKPKGLEARKQKMRRKLVERQKGEAQFNL
eukprot:TRINITY_DN9565_c0_g1_i1.p1 TRINITY_DN9565_c0_g1~~TRINITY_DN9565_c0_g1_i1.p1  ORF type:complete len:550 (+),score=68.36 TRINITY_DN9565_c0_g1_i1:567-2216(+)